MSVQMPDCARASWTRIPLPPPDAGVLVEGVACVRARTERRDKYDNPYYVLDLGHRDGKTQLKIWHADVRQWAAIGDGDAVFLRLEGKAARAPWPAEWRVLVVQKLDAEHPVRDDLLPACPIPLAELTARDAAVRAELSPPAAALLDVVLAHVGVERYRRAAAAERLHHAVAPHGLWWHSLEVAEAALALARAIPTYREALAVDVLVLGALLHDLGKVLEYEVLAGIGIRRAPLAQARYHTTLGIQLVTEAVTRGEAMLTAAGTPRWLIDAVLHVIESHHALKEWGSPTAPASREAWLLHLADMASAKLQALSDDVTSATPLDAPGWCRPSDPRHAPLQRFDELAQTLRATSAHDAAAVATTRRASTTDAPMPSPHDDPAMIEIFLLDPQQN